jgi:hypothetical protein
MLVGRRVIFEGEMGRDRDTEIPGLYELDGMIPYNDMDTQELYHDHTL